MEKLEDTKESICIDTDILIDYLRKNEPGTSAYIGCRKKGSTFVTSISAFELHLGAELLAYKVKRSEEVASLLEYHEIIPFDKPSAKSAARIGAELRKAGKAIEIRDLFNASICVSHDMPILTRNTSHYKRIKELKLFEI